MTRRNNADFVRFAAALAVVVSHAYPLTGRDTDEPMGVLSRGQFTLGTLAVTVFFILSGYLITQSYDRGRDLARFLAARALRLMPALVLVVLLTVLVYGPLLTTHPLASYLRNPTTWRYLGAVGLWHMPYKLPGVLELVPFRGVVNGSLWTLWYEVVCYAAVAALGVVGLLRRETVLGLVGLLIVAALVRPGEPYVTLSLPFACGAWWYFVRDHLRVSRRAVLLALGVCAVALMAGHGAAVIVPVAGSYLVLAATFHMAGPLVAWAEWLGGDLSYGLYVYAFPVEQAIVWLWPAATPLALTMLAVPPVLALAAVSWRVVERPALRLKHRPFDVRRAIGLGAAPVRLPQSPAEV